MKTSPTVSQRIVALLQSIYTASFLLILVGCDSGTRWQSGDYEVYWIDISEDLTLGLNLGGGSSIGRVMPRVIALGEDKRWIVAARHPDGDMKRTEYYYFAKAEDHPHKNADEVVKGPFTEHEFNLKSKELGLPPLTIRF